jgi:hypothetical protein
MLEFGENDGGFEASVALIWATTTARAIARKRRRKPLSARKDKGLLLRLSLRENERTAHTHTREPSFHLENKSTTNERARPLSPHMAALSSSLLVF